jgi:hypothetical protein
LAAPSRGAPHPLAVAATADTLVPASSSAESRIFRARLMRQVYLTKAIEDGRIEPADTTLAARKTRFHRPGRI